MRKKNNVVLIIPTGIGAEIGGHAGDGNPVAKLLASVADTLITHPNVVNASDINEMPENTLYVEGSILDRFLWADIELRPVDYNKILVVVNPPLTNETVNAVSAARVTIGADISILTLDTPLRMVASIDEAGASGTVIGWEKLIAQIQHCDYDALAITTPIEVEKEMALKYMKNGGINPWGGVEALASKLIADAINKPVAHSPCGDTIPDYREIVDPRMAAEMVSTCYLHCILKGLHKAPQIGKGLSVDEISCLITPINCVGEPHHACMEKGITIIAVKQNKTCLNDKMPDEFIQVENYLEAAGLVASMRAGIYWESVLRPLGPTQIYKKKETTDGR
jgi:hypothetical protein